MPQYLLNLSDGQMEGVRTLSAEYGVPMSFLFRAAVDNLLQSGMSLCLVYRGVVASGASLPAVGNGR